MPTAGEDKSAEALASLHYYADEFLFSGAQQKFLRRREIDLAVHVVDAGVVDFHAALLYQTLGLAARCGHFEIHKQYG